MSDQIHAGDPVIVTATNGAEFAAVAASGIFLGRDMEVVLVQLDGQGEPTPWPAASVRLAQARMEGEHA